MKTLIINKQIDKTYSFWKKLLSVFVAFFLVSLMIPSGLVASAKNAEVEVTFHLNNGQPDQTITVEKGKTLAKPEDPINEGYTLGNWCKDEKFWTDWNFEKDTVDRNTDLYARWDKNIEDNVWSFRAIYGAPFNAINIPFGTQAISTYPKDKEIITLGGNNNKDKYVWNSTDRYGVQISDVSSENDGHYIKYHVPQGYKLTSFTISAFAYSKNYKGAPNMYYGTSLNKEEALYNAQVENERLGQSYTYKPAEDQIITDSDLYVFNDNCGTMISIGTILDIDAVGVTLEKITSYTDVLIDGGEGHQNFNVTWTPESGEIITKDIDKYSESQINLDTEFVLTEDGQIEVNSLDPKYLGVLKIKPIAKQGYKFVNYTIDENVIFPGKHKLSDYVKENALIHMLANYKKEEPGPQPIPEETASVSLDGLEGHKSFIFTWVSDDGQVETWEDKNYIEDDISLETLIYINDDGNIVIVSVDEDQPGITFVEPNALDNYEFCYFLLDGEYIIEPGLYTLGEFVDKDEVLHVDAYYYQDEPIPPVPPIPPTPPTPTPKPIPHPQPNPDVKPIHPADTCSIDAQSTPQTSDYTFLVVGGLTIMTLICFAYLLLKCNQSKY